MQFIKKLYLPLSIPDKHVHRYERPDIWQINVEGTYCTSLSEHKFQEGKMTAISCVEQGGQPCQTSTHILSAKNLHIYILHLVVGS